MRGTRTVEDPRTGIRVSVSRAAQYLIGLANVNDFVKALTELMGALGAEWAYVSKAGNAVEIDVHRKDGWHGRMKVRKGH